MPEIEGKSGTAVPLDAERRRERGSGIVYGAKRAKKVCESNQDQHEDREITVSCPRGQKDTARGGTLCCKKELMQGGAKDCCSSSNEGLQIAEVGPRFEGPDCSPSRSATAVCVLRKLLEGRRLLLRVMDC